MAVTLTQSRDPHLTITDRPPAAHPSGCSRSTPNDWQPTPAKPRAFDVVQGRGIYTFPSRLPETYYACLLSAISECTAELQRTYPSETLWREFAPPAHPPLDAYTLTDAALIQPLMVLGSHLEDQLRPQIDPVYTVCHTEFITVRWYTGEVNSVGSFFKLNPDAQQLELFRHGRSPFVEIHVDPGKSIVSPHTCQIKFCITLTPLGQDGESIVHHAQDIGTLYDPLGCRRITGRRALTAADLAATPTMDVVCFLTTRGASAFNQVVKQKYPVAPSGFTPAKGVKHRAAEQRAPWLQPRPGDPFAPRVLLHGGVHLRRAPSPKPLQKQTG